jgi:hypothetical protein
MSSFLNAYASKALPLQAETCSMVSGQTSQELERPYPGVETQADDSWYDGMGDALFGGVAGAYYETMSTAQTLLGNAAGKVDKDWEAQLDEWAKENRKIAQQQYAPDPELSTTAAQIVYGASKELSKIGLAAAAALPLTALGAPGAAVGGVTAVGYALNSGIQSFNEQLDQGIDPETAEKVATVGGIAGGLGVIIPGGFGLRTLGNAAVGAGVNMGFGIAERATIHKILENADYSQAAEQYDPADPTSLAIEGILGGVVGAVSARRGSVTVTKETEDAARVREQTLANRANLPVDTNNQAKTSDAYRAQQRTEEQMNAGEPVSVAPAAVDQTRIDQIKRESAKRLQESMAKDGIIKQNRDRSSAASITQMNSIAANPDYMRLGFSRDFTSGAPVVAYAGEVPEVQRGRTDLVVDADGNRYPVQYAVVEAEDILTSNNIDGSINPTYGVGAQMEAMAGNGRAVGLKMAYERGNADNYRSELLADTSHEVPVDVINGMRNPVLVRIMRDEDVKANMGDITNRSATQQLSVAEQAMTDAARIDLSRLSFTDTGAISPDSVREFVALLPAEERAALIDSHGVPNDDAVRRLKNAIFQSTYKTTTLTDLINTTDKEQKAGIANVLTAFQQAAPRLLKLEGAGELDFRPAIAEILGELAESRRRGKGLSLDELSRQPGLEGLNRSPEVEALLQWLTQIEGQKGARRAISDTLGELADFVRTNLDNQAMGGDMFGDVPPIQRVDVAREFSRKTGVEIDEAKFIEVRDLNDAVRKERMVNSDADVQVALRAMAEPPIASAPDFELITVAKDSDGTEHRVWGVSGNPDLMQLPDGIDGVKPLPVRLQEGTRAGDHLRKHEKQLLKGAGYSSAEEAIWDVAQNYRWITRGTKENALRIQRQLAVEENGTIRRAVLQVELQEEAGIYRVGSVFFSTKPFNETAVLFDRQAPDRGPLSPVRPTSELASTRALTRKQTSSAEESIGQKIADVNDVKRAAETARQVTETQINRQLIDQVRTAEDSRLQQEAMFALEQNPNMRIQLDEGDSSVSAAEFIKRSDDEAQELENIANQGVPTAVVCAFMNGGLDGK